MSVTALGAGVLLGLVSASFATTPPTLQTLEAHQRDTSHMPTEARIEAISALFLGLPYERDSHGEGTGPDPDPMIRFDAFDCLTFVEEVLAWSLVNSPKDTMILRHELKWGSGEATYHTRNHSMELQWLPNAVRAGVITPAAPLSSDTVSLERVIGVADWNQWQGRGHLHLTDAQLPTGVMRLDVAPIASALEHIDQIPDGSVVLVVRQPKADQPLWVTHVGLALHDGRRMVLRHASARRDERRVTDTDLKAYLSRLTTYRSWPVLGIAVFSPNRRR